MENIFKEIDYNVKKAFDTIEEICIKNGRNPNDVNLMAVTKTQDILKVEQAIKSGITLCGENRVQELVEKAELFKKYNVPCHIIGQLQTNKVKYLPELTDYIQSVDSIKLATEIDKQYAKFSKIANVLVEVNIGQENSKSGIVKDDAYNFICQISQLKNISVQGLMCVPPQCEGDLVRRYFEQMNNLFIDISAKKVDNVNMTMLSMGMSHDYTYAIAEGSTLVRVGQGIFGPRNYNKI